MEGTKAAAALQGGEGMARPSTIAMTAGDPCGIGPEVILKTLATVSRAHRKRLIIIGDLPVFHAAAARLQHPLPPWSVVSPPCSRTAFEAGLTFLDCGRPGTFVPGRPSRQAGRASLAYLEQALALWRMRQIDALVTAPVTKWAIARVSRGFVGQTEYLASATGTRDVVMMFVSDRLRVALLTRHLPLRRVARAINRRLLLTSVALAAEALASWFRIPHPKLALCGLNPHAGESSRESEEARIMRPALRTLRRRGIRCDGPFAADGLFAGASLAYDAIICAYHDQGLIPFKMSARDRGCQLSVGLPLVRTSPDHGSALDIAGKSIANPGSMRYALQLAERLARKTR